MKERPSQPLLRPADDSDSPPKKPKPMPPPMRPVYANTKGAHHYAPPPRPAVDQGEDADPSEGDG